MADPLRLLILEDQPSDADLMIHELRRDGFAPDWRRVDHEADYTARLAEPWDVILSDYDLPGFTALRALEILKARGLDTPFIVVSGVIREEIAVECLKQGAADYLLKDRLSRLGPAVRQALEEKRLRHETRLAELDLRRQSLQAASLVRVAARLSAGLDLQAILSAVCEETARAFNVVIASVHLYDEKRHALYPAGGYGLPEGFIERARPLPRAVYEAYARQMGHVFVLPDVQALPNLPNPEWYAAMDLRTVVLAGMWREAQLVGALSIGVEGAVRQFTDDELALLKGLADQAALAISNALQHQRMHRRLQESEALAAISRALNETLNLERILHMIVDAARQIIPQVERAVIHLLDEERQALRPAAVAGQIEQLGRPDFTMRPGEGVAGQVIAGGVVINVPDTLTDPRYLPLGRATHMRSLLVAPVQSGARRLGTISVQSAAPDVFTRDDEQLLATLGTQAALAIENARLFEVERRRAEEAEALQQVTQTLISRLHLSEMLQAVVEAILTVADYRCVAIFLLEDERLVLSAAKGYPASAPRLLPLEGSLAGRVIRTGEPSLISDLSADAGEADLAESPAPLGIPLVHADQAAGVLLVEAQADRPLDQSNLNWLITVGRHLGVAIQNTRLVADLEKALQQEKAVRNRLVQTEKLAAMGRLVASVAHELNNPLQAIQNALYLVKQESGLSEQAHDDLHVALTEANRMAELIKRLREAYRPTLAEQFKRESLNAIVEEVQKLIATHLRHNRVHWEFDPDPDLPPVAGMRDQLKQVFLNLSLNAVEAMPHGGDLVIRTRHLPETGQALVTLADTGSGIEPAALPNIFDPFFTTKESGTGLGLAITYDIVQRHGGRIDVESAVGQGTTFKVWFPVDNGLVTGQNAGHPREA
jgi:signal transduction histidine kinase